MTDDEIHAAIAISLGWVETSDAGVYRDRSTSLIVGALPDWTHSLDACARDLLPVARERGWWAEYAYNPDWSRQEPEEFKFINADGMGEIATAYAPTGEIARALCLAWLAGPGLEKVVAG